MTDRAQFEAMLNALINEDQDAAKEIFHNIVVGKSREIYQELLAEDFSKDTGNPYASDDEEEEEEGTEEEGSSEEEEEEGSDDEFGGEDDAEDGEDDAEDDAEGGFGDEMDDAEEEGGDVEARVMDLEDALEDLKAEFEQLLSQEEEEGNHDIGAIHAAGGEEGGAMGGDEFGGDEGGMDELDELMEYTLKVGNPKHGDNGVNTRSAVAGKNDMGGTTANIAKSFSTTTGGTKGGLAAPTTKEENFGNINVPGGKAGKTAFTKREPGHGAEKKGAAEKADNKNSMLNGAPKRAK